MILDRDDEGALDVVGSGMYLGYELIDYMRQPSFGSRIPHKYTVHVSAGKCPEMCDVFLSAIQWGNVQRLL